MSEIQSSEEKIINFFQERQISLDLYKSENDDEIFIFDFPRDENYESSKNELDHFANEIETLEVCTNFARTKSRIQFPIFASDSLIFILENFNFSFDNQEFQIKIVSKPLLIGIANVKLNLYSKYFPPLTTYSAIEILDNSNKTLDSKTAYQIIKTFIFELFQATNIAIELAELHDFDAVYYENDDEYERDFKNIVISELPKYNDAIDFYLKAELTSDTEIRFLYFYKIIEYFSPKVANLKAYQNLSKKLDSVKYKSTTTLDLDHIIEIAESLRKSKSDSELSNTVLSISIDIVALFNFLPDSVKVAICKNIKARPDSINYSLASDTLDGIIRELGRVIYSTRNSIVHAKSNYKPNEFACKLEDLPQMNVFLSKATYQILKWNDTLPRHLW